MDLRFLGINSFDFSIERKGGVYHTPAVPSLFSTRRAKKKLRDYIENVARTEEADIALITQQGDEGSFLARIDYTFELYKYKH